MQSLYWKFSRRASSDGVQASRRAELRQTRGGERLEGETEIVRRLESLARILLQAAPNDTLQARGHSRSLDLGWIAPEDRRDRVHGRRPREGTPAGEHLVEDRAQGEQVRARVGPQAHGLLG
jgi:hypothetical protein